MKLTARCLALAIVSVPFVAMAQTPGSPSAPAETLVSLIQALQGSWRLNVHIEPMGPKDKAIDGPGEELWSAGPGNITLIEQEHVPMPGSLSDLMGVIWWDSRAKRFGGMECNSQMPFTCDLKGALNDITVTWDGKKFQIDEIETHGDSHYVWHESWSQMTADSFEQNGDVTLADGSTRHLMTAKATRVQKLDHLGGS